MRELPNLDVQPEPDLPASALASLGLGLLVGDGLLFCAGMGAIMGHHMLNNAFGMQQDIFLGGLAGAIVGIVAAILSIRGLTNRYLKSEM